MSNSLRPHGPGSAVHGILQARVLEWVAISFSRGSSQPRDRTRVSHIAGRRFYLLSHQGSLLLLNFTSNANVFNTQLLCLPHPCFLCFFYIFLLSAMAKLSSGSPQLIQYQEINIITRFSSWSGNYST